MTHHAIRHGLTVMLVLAAAQMSGLLAEVNAQQFRYNWKAGQKFSYRFDISVNDDDATTTYKGVTNYTVDAADSEQMRVTYRGGLTESKKIKQSRSRGPFGGPFRGPMGPPRIPSPFSRPVFAGKTQTTNKITLTPQGDVLAMDGDSQLPYLLGNVSLLPFEPLPEGSEREWTHDSGVAITKENNNSRHPFGHFGPFGPFAGEDKKSMQAASEVARFSLQDVKANLAKIAKSYDLTMEQTKDHPAFAMTGKGTWTFDKAESVPQALDMSYELTVTQGNTTSKIPITVKFIRISAAELAEIEATKKREEEERAQAAAEAKAKAEAPLTGDEKREAMSALASRDNAAITEMLGKLAAKTPKDPDPEVAAAIEKHLKSPDKKIADGAHKALVNWSPDYKLKDKLAKDYRGPAVLKSTDLVVESITPLYVGQLLQARKTHGPFWYAAKVKELLPDGTVKVAFLTWGNERGTEIVPRNRLQLAPKELEQPARPASAPAAVSKQLRTWSDSTGRFQIQATFVSFANGQVSLRRADNRVISLPMEKLSAGDQAYVKQLQQAENPFFVP